MNAGNHIAESTNGNRGALSSAEKWFVRVAALLLVLTAIAKITSAGGNARLLDSNDPILPMARRWVFVMVGSLEIIAAVYLFCNVPAWRKIAAVGWMASLFLIYRAGIWYMGVPAPCSCLGNPYAWSEFVGRNAKTITNVILIYFTSGACFFGIRHLLAFRNRTTDPGRLGVPETSG